MAMGNNFYQAVNHVNQRCVDTSADKMRIHKHSAIFDVFADADALREKQISLPQHSYFLAITILQNS